MANTHVCFACLPASFWGIAAALAFAFLLKCGLVAVLYRNLKKEAQHTDKVEKVGKWKRKCPLGGCD